MSDQKVMEKVQALRHEAISTLTDGSFYENYDRAGLRLGALRDLVSEHDELVGKVENLLIGIGMGWDLDQLIEEVKPHVFVDLKTKSGE